MQENGGRLVEHRAGEKRKTSAEIAAIRCLLRGVGLHRNLSGGRARASHAVGKVGMRPPVTELLILEDATVQLFHQHQTAARGEPGADRQSAPPVVRLEFEATAIAALEQFPKHAPEQACPLDCGFLPGQRSPPLARFWVAVVAARVVRRRDQHQRGDHGRGLQEREGGVDAPRAGEVVAGDVGRFVAEEVGQRLVGQVQVGHPFRDEDEAAGQSEGIGVGDVEDVEGEQDVRAIRLAGHRVADPVDPGQEGVVLDEPEVERIGAGRLQADLEAVGPVGGAGCPPDRPGLRGVVRVALRSAIANVVVAKEAVGEQHG